MYMGSICHTFALCYSVLSWCCCTHVFSSDANPYIPNQRLNRCDAPYTESGIMWG